MNYREVNTLSLTADKYISKDEASKTFLSGEFRFTNETDAGNFSRPVQEWWHRYSKETLKKNIIQYRYVTDEKDRNTVTLLGGFGKKWLMNMGNWKCDVEAQVKFGMSVDNNQKVSAELKHRAQLKIHHSALPWLALSTWIQKSNGFQGPATDGGVLLSVEKKINKVVVKPFIGIERHRTKLDTKYGVDGRPNENYHVFGVTIKY